MSITSDVLVLGGLGIAAAVAWWQRDAIMEWLSGPEYNGTPGTGIVIPPWQQNAEPGTYYWSGLTWVRVSVPTDPSGYATRADLVKDYCRRNSWDTNFCSAVGAI